MLPNFAASPNPYASMVDYVIKHNTKSVGTIDRICECLTFGTGGFDVVLDGSSNQFYILTITACTGQRFFINSTSVAALFITVSGLPGVKGNWTREDILTLIENNNIEGRFQQRVMWNILIDMGLSCNFVVRSSGKILNVFLEETIGLPKSKELLTFTHEESDVSATNELHILAGTRPRSSTFVLHYNKKKYTINACNPHECAEILVSRVLGLRSAKIHDKNFMNWHSEVYAYLHGYFHGDISFGLL